MGSEVVVGGLHYYLAFFLFAASVLAASASSAPHNVATGSADMTPAADQELNHLMLLNHSARRMLGSFQVCALCTCCGGSRGLCLPSPCCYAINCNIPNRPFGFCSFSPMACNCLGCHL